MPVARDPAIRKPDREGRESSLWTNRFNLPMFSLPGGDVDRFAAMGSLIGPLASGSSCRMTLEAWRKLVFLRFEGLLSEWGQASGRFCGPFGLAGI